MSFCEDKGRERLYKRVMAARVTKGWSKSAIQKIQNAKILKYKKYRNTLYNSARQYYMYTREEGCETKGGLSLRIVINLHLAVRSVFDRWVICISSFKQSYFQIARQQIAVQ